MGELEMIQAAQTAALLTVAAAMIYVLILLRIEIRRASLAMRDVLRNQKEIEESIERIWKRIDEIETAHGLRIDFDALNRIKRLLDALEAAGKPPDPTQERAKP
jgi:predicted DsbA family dithiol-disulfide isomerase